MTADELAAGVAVVVILLGVLAGVVVVVVCEPGEPRWAGRLGRAVREHWAHDGGDVIPRACPGPLIWYDVPPATADGPARALLECGARGCGYLVGSTSNIHDPAHRDTPLMRVPT